MNPQPGQPINLLDDEAMDLDGTPVDAGGPRRAPIAVLVTLDSTYTFAESKDFDSNFLFTFEGQTSPKRTGHPRRFNLRGDVLLVERR